jgi:N-acetyl-gamma-glutamyl-phosphate reductase
MEQEISRLCGRSVRITFVPHLLPVSRGILTTLYATLVHEVNEEEMLRLYRRYYSGEPFVRILPGGVTPNIREVRGTNLCDIGLRPDPRTNRVIVLSAIDNLVKGASGQAVQNMNLLFGLPETLGLETPPLFI